MSTICCMLHLFGSGLGQNGSTRYFGGEAARCCAPTTARTTALRTMTVIASRRFGMAPLYTSCPRRMTDSKIGRNQAHFRQFLAGKPLASRVCGARGTVARRGGDRGPGQREGCLLMFARFIAAMVVVLAVSAPAWAGD